MYLLKLVVLSLNLTAKEIIKLKFYCKGCGVILLEIRRKHLIIFVFSNNYNFVFINQFLDVFNSFKLIPLYFAITDNLQKFRLPVFKNLIMKYFNFNTYNNTKRVIKVALGFTILKNTVLFFFFNRFFFINFLQLILTRSKILAK